MPDSVFDHKQFLKTVSTGPGIYQMFDANEKILYVGKAKNIKNRLNSYFRESDSAKSGLSIKTRVLVEKIANIQITITESETAALVLEQNLIKALKPPYNISLRDDKSYPYIFISDGEYPRISSHRGARKKKGHYFGPYPSTASVYQSLNFLKKIFRVRQCEDSVFKNRSRPCLQYQINRCTAPCVKFIEPEAYQKDIKNTEMFLKGQSNELMQQLANEMEAESTDLNFEQAAFLRDQIAALRQIQSGHSMEAGTGNIDVFSLFKKTTHICVHVVFIRDGRILGSKSYFHEDKLDIPQAESLLSFIEQFYLASKNRELPHEIIVNQVIADVDKKILIDVLAEKIQRKIVISHNVKSQRQKWLILASNTAEQNLLQQLGTKASLLKRFECLQEVLSLDEIPQRMECFDISHSSGELTVASCVVFNQQGAIKSDYRRFNIEGITGGDDYAAMEQALTRRYTRLQKGEGVLPDLLVIDGGKGQLGKAKAVLAELGVSQLMLLAKRGLKHWYSQMEPKRL
jgi:excinuclease ABC subunit C